MIVWVILLMNFIATVRPQFITLKPEFINCPREKGVYFATSPDCLFYYRCDNRFLRLQACYPWQKFDIHTLKCSRRWEVDCNPMYAGIWRPMFGNNPSEVDESGSGTGAADNSLEEVIGENPFSTNLENIENIGQEIPEETEAEGQEELGTGESPLINEGSEKSEEISGVDQEQPDDNKSISQFADGSKEKPLIMGTNKEAGNTGSSNKEIFKENRLDQNPGAVKEKSSLVKNSAEKIDRFGQEKPEETEEKPVEPTTIENPSFMGKTESTDIPTNKQITVQENGMGVENPITAERAISEKPEESEDNKENSLTEENTGQEKNENSEDNQNLKGIKNPTTNEENMENTAPAKMNSIQSAFGNQELIENLNSKSVENPEDSTTEAPLTKSEETSDSEVPATITEVKSPPDNISFETENPVVKQDLEPEGFNLENSPPLEEVVSTGKELSNSEKSSIDNDQELKISEQSLNPANNATDKDTSESKTLQDRIEKRCTDNVCEEKNKDNIDEETPNKLFNPVLPQDTRSALPQDLSAGSTGKMWYWCGSGRFVLAANSEEGDAICLQLPDPESINSEGSAQTGGDWAGHTFLDTNNEFD
ncbi:muscle M-line assembly protein unc-89-like [Macrosteles quadrilineatus]|uniref:muscle M-line assembly protein unc-89-like n=1 Tax=Macrosteles quadrilineatus TaxID=74068 RepID=UPI0023E29FCB|nr:muscle M-line assembly protein unc-89-like [Macrosteles quadrilineatus]